MNIGQIFSSARQKLMLWSNVIYTGALLEMAHRGGFEDPEHCEFLLDHHFQDVRTLVK